MAYLKLQCDTPHDAIDIVQRAGKLANESAYAELTALCSDQGNYEAAQTAYAQLQKRGIKPSVRIFNALIFSPDMRHSWAYVFLISCASSVVIATYTHGLS